MDSEVVVVGGGDDGGSGDTARTVFGARGVGTLALWGDEMVF
jgi:hypothetical protein